MSPSMLCGRRRAVKHYSAYSSMQCTILQSPWTPTACSPAWASACARLRAGAAAPRSRELAGQRRALRALPRPGGGGAGEHLGAQARQPRPRARARRPPSCSAAPGGERALPVIALLGLRGAGKTTIGRRLARRLRVPFVELDRRIEEAAGLALDEIFALHGEEYYRRLERETLERVLARRAARSSWPRAAASSPAPRPSRSCGSAPSRSGCARTRRTTGTASCSRATGGPWPTTRRPWPSCAACSPRASRSTASAAHTVDTSGRGRGRGRAADRGPGRAPTRRRAPASSPYRDDAPRGGRKNSIQSDEGHLAQRRMDGRCVRAARRRGRRRARSAPPAGPSAGGASRPGERGPGRPLRVLFRRVARELRPVLGQDALRTRSRTTA